MATNHQTPGKMWGTKEIPHENSRNSHKSTLTPGLAPGEMNGHAAALLRHIILECVTLRPSPRRTKTSKHPAPSFSTLTSRAITVKALMTCCNFSYAVFFLVTGLECSLLEKPVHAPNLCFSLLCFLYPKLGVSATDLWWCLSFRFAGQTWKEMGCISCWHGNFSMTIITVPSYYYSK